MADHTLKAQKESTGLLPNTAADKSYGSTKYSDGTWPLSTVQRKHKGDIRSMLDKHDSNEVEYASETAALKGSQGSLGSGRLSVCNSDKCSEHDAGGDDEVATGLNTVSPRKKKILLVALAIMDMAGGIMFGIIGPFYPTAVSTSTAIPST